MKKKIKIITSCIIIGIVGLCAYNAFRLHDLSFNSSYTNLANKRVSITGYIAPLINSKYIYLTSTPYCSFEDIITGTDDSTIANAVPVMLKSTTVSNYTGKLVTVVGTLSTNQFKDTNLKVCDYRIYDAKVIETYSENANIKLYSDLCDVGVTQDIMAYAELIKSGNTAIDTSRFDAMLIYVISIQDSSADKTAILNIIALEKEIITMQNADKDVSDTKYTELSNQINAYLKSLIITGA